jgi:hypothetical protein
VFSLIPAMNQGCTRGSITGAGDKFSSFKAKAQWPTALLGSQVEEAVSHSSYEKIRGGLRGRQRAYAQRGFVSYIAMGTLQNRAHLIEVPREIGRWSLAAARAFVWVGVTLRRWLRYQVIIVSWYARLALEKYQGTRRSLCGSMHLTGLW